MPNDLVPIDVDGAEVGWSRGAGIDQWAVVYGNIVSPLPSSSFLLLTRRTAGRPPKTTRHPLDLLTLPRTLSLPFPQPTARIAFTSSLPQRQMSLQHLPHALPSSINPPAPLPPRPSVFPFSYSPVCEGTGEFNHH